MKGDRDLPYTVRADGARLAVRLTPRAGRDELGGRGDGGGGRIALAVRIAAPPVDGAANRALIGFLARRLGVPNASIRILSGERSRLKILFVAGADEVTMASLL